MLSECHPKGSKNLKNAELLGTGKKQLGSRGPIWKPVCRVLHSRSWLALSVTTMAVSLPVFFLYFFPLRISNKTLLDTQITHIINIYMFEFWRIEGNQVRRLTFHVMLLKIKGFSFSFCYRYTGFECGYGD